MAILIVEPGIVNSRGAGASHHHLRARRKTRRLLQRCYRMWQWGYAR
ncbi:MAG TPA: hypothetical protein VFN35_24165 [Ktedonobacteraceae bacterium]|nr:hypothetical protein [Ktedonobacteraceae bacterium]